MSKFKKDQKRLQVPRHVLLIAKKLDIRFQPNKGSSFYKRTPKNKVKQEQEDWNSPFGTIRLSDHWNYTNQKNETAYKTNQPIPERSWALCINTGAKADLWKLIEIISLNGSNLMEKEYLTKLSNKITREINLLN